MSREDGFPHFNELQPEDAGMTQAREHGERERDARNR